MLWSHVYHPYRLHLVSRCKTVRGTVEEVRWEPDGDLHILLAVSRSLVNSENVSYEHGDLVLEVICQGTITQADAVGTDCARRLLPEDPQRQLLRAWRVLLVR